MLQVFLLQVEATVEKVHVGFLFIVLSANLVALLAEGVVRSGKAWRMFVTIRVRPFGRPVVTADPFLA